MSRNLFASVVTGRRIGQLSASLAAAALLLAGVSCEIDSYMDPSVVGRWERTPVVLPILDRLDVIETDEYIVGGLSRVQPADLVPDVREYVMGPGDLVTVTVFELIVPGVDAVYTRRIDEVGMMRLPIIGPIKASGESASGLERRISGVLADKGIIEDATVSVILQETRQNTFSIIGEPGVGRTAFGTYAIPRADFRLLDALAMARGVPGRTKTLLVIRQIPLTPEVAGEVPVEPARREGERAPDEPADPADLIEGLLRGVDEPAPETAPAPPPPGVEAGLDDGNGAPRYVFIEGQWVKVEGSVAERAAAAGLPAQPGEATEVDLSGLMTQRIIEVPFERLNNGDMRYNLIVRPRDIIKVPDVSAGFVYIMGAINRPGAYTVPGEKDLTLKQLVASAGSLSAIAIPERVDITRRIGDNQEATMRLNLRSIFNGTQPDIFLKPNDTINVGTSLIASPLAVIRNGFRMTYGFGFLLDRNFDNSVFGPR